MLALAYSDACPYAAEELVLRQMHVEFTGIHQERAHWNSISGIMNLMYLLVVTKVGLAAEMANLSLHEFRICRRVGYFALRVEFV